jgi:hypothetical protein
VTRLDFRPIRREFDRGGLDRRLWMRGTEGLRESMCRPTGLTCGSIPARPRPADPSADARHQRRRVEVRIDLVLGGEPTGECLVHANGAVVVLEALEAHHEATDDAIVLRA